MWIFKMLHCYDLEEFTLLTDIQIWPSYPVVDKIPDQDSRGEGPRRVHSSSSVVHLSQRQRTYIYTYDTIQCLDPWMWQAVPNFSTPNEFLPQEDVPWAQKSRWLGQQNPCAHCASHQSQQRCRQRAAGWGRPPRWWPCPDWHLAAAERQEGRSHWFCGCNANYVRLN